MGVVIYNLLLGIYRLLLSFSSSFNTKAAEFIEGRKNLMQNLQNEIDQDSKICWFHCASLGEFEQGRPIIEAFRSTYPDFRILITFFSPSGYRVQKNYDGADYVFYLPYDTAKNARVFMEIVNPRIAIFIKYEFWHHYYRELQTRQIPFVLVSALFRQDQVFFKWYGGFYRSVLRRLNYIFTQDKGSETLLNSINYTNTSVAGDTRFDRVWKIRSDSEDVPFIPSFTDNKRTLIIGSCWKEDLEVLIPFINNPPNDMRFIIAPHEISEKNLRFIEQGIQGESVRYGTLTGEIDNRIPVVIIDNVGMLSKLYKYADFAFIGGAFGDGLHNILEAATFGLPIFFGNKNYKKFREARELIELGGAIPVKDYFEFSDNIEPFLTENRRKLTSDIVYSYIRANTGATDVAMSHLRKLINEGDRS